MPHAAIGFAQITGTASTKLSHTAQQARPLNSILDVAAQSVQGVHCRHRRLLTAARRRLRGVLQAAVDIVLNNVCVVGGEDGSVG